MQPLENTESLVPAKGSDLRGRGCGPPQDVIDAMVAAGARKDEAVGENLLVLRIEGVDSLAWSAP
jgi:hypothetical protein